MACCIKVRQHIPLHNIAETWAQGIYWGAQSHILLRHILRGTRPYIKGGTKPYIRGHKAIYCLDIYLGCKSIYWARGIYWFYFHCLSTCNREENREKRKREKENNNNKIINKIIKIKERSGMNRILMTKDCNQDESSLMRVALLPGAGSLLRGRIGRH